MTACRKLEMPVLSGRSHREPFRRLDVERVARLRRDDRALPFGLGDAVPLHPADDVHDGPFSGVEILAFEPGGDRDQTALLSRQISGLDLVHQLVALAYR